MWLLHMEERRWTNRYEQKGNGKEGPTCFKPPVSTRTNLVPQELQYPFMEVEPTPNHPLKDPTISHNHDTGN